MNDKNDLMLKDWKVTKDKRRQKYPEYDQNVHILRKYFTTASNGVFHRNLTFLSEGKMPKVIGIDPGQINIWRASILDEEKKVLHLSYREYNKSIGLIANKKWIERKTQITLYTKKQS